MKRTNQILAADAMYTVRDVRNHPETEEELVEALHQVFGTNGPSFDDWLRRLQAEIDNDLTAIDYPPGGARILVRDGEWCEVADLSKEERSEIRVGDTWTLGYIYIKKKEVALSNIWWLGRMSEVIHYALVCTGDLRLFRIVELGRIFTQRETHRNFLDRVAWGVDKRDASRRGGGHNERPDRDAIIAAMRRRGADQKGKARNAARLTFESDGLGASTDGNLAIWNRAKPRPK